MKYSLAKSEALNQFSLNLLAGFFMLLLYFVGNSVAAQQDPFKRSGHKTHGNTTDNTTDSVEAQPSQTGSSKVEAGTRQLNWREKLLRITVLPPWFREWQRSMQAKVSRTALELKRSRWSDSWYLYILGLVLAIVFGFLHVIGPGHGKTFTVSYFMTQNASLKQGLWLSALINIVDSVSAALVVFLTYKILSLTFSQSFWVESIVSVISYSIIVIWGVLHLVSHLRGSHNCCGHGHSHVHNHAQETGHDHQHHKKLHAERDQETQTSENTPNSSWFLALGVGLIPCPVCSVMLMFGLLNQILGITVFLVVGVSIGGMIAMTLLSFAVIGSKKGAESLVINALRLGGAQSAGKVAKLSAGVEIAALLVMIVWGSLFLILSLPL